MTLGKTIERILEISGSKKKKMVIIEFVQAFIDCIHPLSSVEKIKK